MFNRLGDVGMNGGPGPRDPPTAPSRPSVFDRLYSQGSRAAGSSAAVADRDGAPALGLHRSSSAADDGPGSRQLGRRLTSRISSAVVAPADTGREQSPSRGDAEQREPSAGRKRLLSAVMVNGQARQLSGSLDRVTGEVPEERPPKRPTLAADDKTKRRAARMFGTLLVGTLQKFQNDEQAFKKTDTAQRRADMERRAQERAEAEAQRLKQEAAAAWREERENKLNALHDLNLQAEIKALQLQYAKRVQLRQQLTGFCVTNTHPQLYWLPKQTSKESVPLLEESQAAFEAWKEQQLQELEAERAELVQAAAAKREAALARLAARQPPGPDAAAGDGDGEHGLDGSEDEGAAGADGRGGQQDEGDAEHGEEQQQEQHSEEQQEQDEETQDQVEAEGGEEAEQGEQQEQQRPVRRPRQRRPEDDDEERLLSSDEDDV